MNADALSRHPMDTSTAAEESDQQAEVVNQVILKEDQITEEDTREMARLQLCSRPTFDSNAQLS